MSEDRIRLDKWLWCARFYKTRSIAAEACEKGHLRLNGHRVEKPGRELRPGDVLTIPQGRTVVAVRVIAGALRRGPAPEARQLYDLVEDEPAQ